MSIEATLLIATGLLAVVAVVAATVAVRAVKRLQHPGTAAAEPEPTTASSELAVVEETTQAPRARVIEGRVIVTPTEQQVLATALGRPAVRLSVFAAGLSHALRPESRDRIVALMRREYRHRSRVRRRVARRAARAVPAELLQREHTWLGTTQAPAPVDLASRRDRQLRSPQAQPTSSEMVGE